MGEASHPGPEPGTPVGGERPRRERSPPASAPAPAPAGSSLADAQTLLAPAGGPMKPACVPTLMPTSRTLWPASWMQSRGRIRCPVCGLSVSERHGVHPTCRPEARRLPWKLTIWTWMVLHCPLLRPSRQPAQALSGMYRWQRGMRGTRCSLGPWLLWCITAWLELLMLPQCVLCAPGRGGRRRRKAETAFTLDRLQRWQEGERLSLWESRPRCRATRTGPLTPEERRDIGSSWGREGFDGKACAALLSKGLSPSFQALAALHPHRPLPAVPAIADLPLAPCMAPDLIARCLRAVPAETAPGPSGLRVQHLRDACSAGGTDNFIAQLTAVVDLLAQGRAPAAVAPVLAGASLVALPKPAGGVRWNCSAGSRGSAYWLLSRTRRGLFWPAQVGVAVKGGAEKAVHAVRAWSHRHAGSIDKEVLRQATAFPSLARWATWCYRQPSRLQFGDRTLDSSAGVQQGDPLGPLLFLWPCNRWRVNSVRVLWTWPCISWTMACLLVTLPPWELRSS